VTAPHPHMSPLAADRFCQLLELFPEGRQLAGAEFAATWLALDVATGPNVVLMMLEEDARVRAAQTAFAAAVLWDQYRPTEALWACDVFVSSPASLDPALRVEDLPAPSDDPEASEALALYYVAAKDRSGASYATPRLWMATAPYVVDERGFTWRERWRHVPVGWRPADPADALLCMGMPDACRPLGIGDPRQGIVSDPAHWQKAGVVVPGLDDV
jgi:hypothetical protein